MSTDVREWVEGQRAALAKRAYQFVEGDEKIKEALAQQDPNPLRVVLGAAANASCLDEVIVLLRYQHGRAQDKWPLELVTGIEKQLREAIAEAAKKPGKPADFDPVEAMLATAWLGFVVQLHRYHYEARKTAARAGGNAQGQPMRGQPPRGHQQRR